MLLTLIRLSTGDNGTFGALIRDDKPICVTLELPWKNNQHDISCIPAGIYEVRLGFSNRFQKMLYLIQDVPNRDEIEIHIGNMIKDTHGCILLGTAFSFLDYSIANSLLAFNQFMLAMPKDGFTLTIRM